MTTPAKTTPVPRRRGRPRSTEVDKAILDATYALLIEGGLSSVTRDTVAHRAGVGKASVYRRYSGKVPMIVDAFSTHFAPEAPLPDTGSFLEDMREFLTYLVRYIGTDGGRIWASLVAEATRNPTLAEAYVSGVLAHRRSICFTIIERAVERGELPAEVNREALADVGPGLIQYRAMWNPTTVGTALVDEIIGILDLHVK